MIAVGDADDIISPRLKRNCMKFYLQLASQIYCIVSISPLSKYQVKF
jgi:hypothetical protein